MRLTPAAGDLHAVGRPVLELVREFVPATPDGVDVEAGDEGQEAVPAVPDLEGLQGHVPSALLFVESAEEQVHAPMQFLFGAWFFGPTMLTLALMKRFRGHAESSSRFGMKI